MKLPFIFRIFAITILTIFCWNGSVHSEGKTYTRDYFVPEPVYFDLIRNLGAKKGELEGVRELWMKAMKHSEE